VSGEHEFSDATTVQRYVRYGYAYTDVKYLKHSPIVHCTRYIHSNRDLCCFLINFFPHRFHAHAFRTTRAHNHYRPADLVHRLAKEIRRLFVLNIRTSSLSRCSEEISGFMRWITADLSLVIIEMLWIYDN
jgi:hypothetical protein